jgi:hypothetical protein
MIGKNDGNAKKIIVVSIAHTYIEIVFKRKQANN